VRDGFEVLASAFLPLTSHSHLALKQFVTASAIECHYLGVELFCGARRFLLWRRRRHEADKSVAVSARANGGGSGTAAVAVRCAFAKGIAEPIGKTRIWEIEAGGDERRMAYGSAKKCLVTVEEEPIIVLSG
jgi:hypothetical protein